jgi:hypothetical protein
MRRATAGTRYSGTEQEAAVLELDRRKAWVSALRMHVWAAALIDGRWGNGVVDKARHLLDAGTFFIIHDVHRDAPILGGPSASYGRTSRLIRESK